MRKFIIPVAAAAALAFVALDATPAKAQVIITSGYYSPGSYGGYSPYYSGGSGIVIGNAGIGLGTYPAYPGFGYPQYGFSPYYGGGYNSYYRTGYRSDYAGGYGYPGYSGAYRGGYHGGWRR